MKKLTLKMAAIFALAFYVPSVLFAGQYGRALQEGRRRFDSYLERAKIETDQSRFEKIAADGIGAAIFEWERAAEELGLCESEEWKAQRQAFERELGEAAAEAFDQWLLEKKSFAESAAKKSALYAELQKAADEFFFRDQDGGETRIVSEEKIQKAREQWEIEAQKIVQKYLEQNFSETERQDFYFAEEKACNALVNELLYDHDSLKRISGAQEALALASSLAGEIEAQSGRAVEKLFDSLQKDAQGVAAGEAALVQEENWLAQFERELKRGLEKWEEAEDEFLTARAEWEKSAENLYAQESQKWQEAYNELQERKKCWSEKIAEQIQEGEREWQKKFGALDEEISTSLDDFQKALALELDQKERIAQAQVSSYEQCRAILQTARAGIENWNALWAQKYRGLYSYWKTEDADFWEPAVAGGAATSDLRKAVQNWKRGFAASVRQIFSEALVAAGACSDPNKKDFDDRSQKIMSLSEFSSSDEIYSECRWLYLRKEKLGALLGDNMPADAYFDVLCNAETLWTAFLDLQEWLDLFDKFSKKAGGFLSAFCGDCLLDFEICDDFDVEKSKASALLDSWEERVEIAQAVYEYSKNNFSDVESAAQSEANLKEAEALYDQAKAEYQRLVELAPQKEAAVESAREECVLAMQRVDLAIEALDAARKAYDELYDERGSFYASYSESALCELCGRLESLNFLKEDFCKSLAALAQKIYEAAEKEFLERAQEAREIALNGSGQMSYEAPQLDGFDLGQEFESARQSLLDLDGQSGRALSMERLLEIQEALEDAAAQESLGNGALDSFLDDLEVLDQAAAGRLAEKLGALETAGADQNGGQDQSEAESLLGEIKEILENFRGLCERDLQNREAALLLLDGSADEIHDFFDGNERFLQVYQNYASYSAALLKEAQKAAGERLAEAISSAGRESLSAYFDALDQAAQGLDEGGLKVLKLYKSALSEQAACAEREEALRKRVEGLDFKSCELSEIDYFIDVFENYFLEKKVAADFSDYGEAELLAGIEAVIFGRAKILDEIKEFADYAENPSKMARALSKKLAEQERAVKAAQKEYEEALAALEGSGGGKAMRSYSALCDQYNAFLDECSASYQKLLAARKERRLAQEIYFYGQNEYLRLSYDAEKELEAAKEKRDAFAAALCALDAIERNVPLEELDGYKQSYVQYYKARALRVKYERELAVQKERVFQAQAQERKALEKVVKEVGTGDSGAKIPAAARDLVFVKKLADGSYSIKLDAAAKNSAGNEARIKEYYSDLSVVRKDVYQNEFYYSRAFADAEEFLDSLDSKEYSLADLALAAMYFESRFDVSSRAAWFAPGQDPQIDGYYKIGDLPDNVHGVDLAGSYHDGRMAVMAEAYARVLSLGGKDDIAKYILFSETNFSSRLMTDEIRQNALKAAALNAPMRDVKSAADDWDTAATVNFCLAASFAAIACIPFVGSWAEPLAAMFRAIAIPLRIVADKLYETFYDVVAVQAGCSKNLSAALESQSAALGALKDARDKVKKESDRLNVLIGSAGSSGGQVISWKDFSKAIDGALENEKGGGIRDYFYSICDSAAGQKSLKDLFERLSSEEKFMDVGSALEKISLVLDQRREQKKDELALALGERENSLDFDRAAYYKDLISFYAKDVIKNLPVCLGQEMEDFQAEVFGDALEARDECLLRSQSNKLAKKEALYSVLRQSLQDEYSAWARKNQLILQAAAEEWNAAGQKLQDAYNFWQSDWNSRYKSANDEWTGGYSEFLADKQSWIYGQYLGSQAAAAPSVLAGEAACDRANWRVAAAKDKASSLLNESSFAEQSAKSLFDSQKFDRLGELCKDLSAFAKNDSYVQSLFSLEKIDGSLLAALDSSAKVRRQLQEEMQSAAAKLALQELKADVEKALDEYFERLEERNLAFENWELNLVRSSGYSVDPLIHRDAVIGSSLLSVKRETQWVHRYEWFFAERPDLAFDASSYAGNSSRCLMRQAEATRTALQSWAEEIFGSFEKHIGTAPTFREKIDARNSRDRNVASFGSGELGLIMLDYQWNSIKNSQGYSELSKAIYDQQFFDTGIDGLVLPTFRDVVGVMFDAVSSVPALYFVKFIDDAFFDAIDLGMGFKSWEDVLKDALKQGVCAAASFGIGQIVGSVGNALQRTFSVLRTGASGQLFDAAQKAAAGYLTKGVSSSINSFDFVHGKIDWQGAADAWLASSAWTSAAGTLLGGAFNAAGNFDSNGVVLNKNVFGSVAEMNAAIGTWSGAALNAAVSGDFSINIANINGAGFLELGVKDGNFYGGFGRGGVDLSYGTVSAFAKNALAAEKIVALKNGSAQERTLLGSANLLAWSGRQSNLELARGLFDGTRVLAFEDGAGQGRTDGGAIVLDSSLLSLGTEGQARIAALAAFQNALINDGALGEELKTDSVLSSMEDSAAAAAWAYELLGLDAQVDCKDAGLANMTKVYLACGTAGLYAFYAAAKDDAQKHGAKVSGLAELAEQPWFQNEAKNADVLLGFSLSKDEYNELAKKNAVERYVAHVVSVAKANGVSAGEAEKIEKESRQKAEREIQVGVANKEYGYAPEDYESSLKNYGCTLATAAYIAYSITGNVGTLSEANEALKKEGVFVAAYDKNGVAEKNLIGRGDGYAAAVNAIAGGDYLQKDGQDFSVSAEQNGLDKRQEIYDRLKDNSQSDTDVYFTHMRVNQGGVQKFDHSVLLESIDFGDGSDYKSSTFSVMDPWQGGRYAPKNGWADITRADFYKLTQAGKDVYALTRKDLRESAA